MPRGGLSRESRRTGTREVTFEAPLGFPRGNTRGKPVGRLAADPLVFPRRGKAVGGYAAIHPGETLVFNLVIHRADGKLLGFHHGKTW